MDVMVVASDSLTALSLEATLDLGGHRVVARAASAALALERATTSRPALAIVKLGRWNCDELVSIPMAGAVSSLNVSVASGVCLYEARRQRSA